MKKLKILLLFAGLSLQSWSVASDIIAVPSDLKKIHTSNTKVVPDHSISSIDVNGLSDNDSVSCETGNKQVSTASRWRQSLNVVVGLVSRWSLKSPDVNAGRQSSDSLVVSIHHQSEYPFWSQEVMNLSAKSAGFQYKMVPKSEGCSDKALQIAGDFKIGSKTWRVYCNGKMLPLDKPNKNKSNQDDSSSNNIQIQESLISWKFDVRVTKVQQDEYIVQFFEIPNNVAYFRRFNRRFPVCKRISKNRLRIALNCLDPQSILYGE